MVKRQDLKSYPFIVIATLHRLVRIFLAVWHQGMLNRRHHHHLVRFRAGAQPAPALPGTRRTPAPMERPCACAATEWKEHAAAASGRVRGRRAGEFRHRRERRRRHHDVRFRVRDQRVVRFRVRRPRDHRHHRLVCERAFNRDGAASVGVRGRRARRSATGTSAASCPREAKCLQTMYG